MLVAPRSWQGQGEGHAGDFDERPRDYVTKRVEKLAKEQHLEQEPRFLRGRGNECRKLSGFTF